jgi:hypothetical protein
MLMPEYPHQQPYNKSLQSLQSLQSLSETRHHMNQPNEIVMFYKPKSKFMIKPTTRRQLSIKMLSSKRIKPKTRTRKLTYARVSYIKPISSNRLRTSPRTSKRILRPVSKKSKSVSSIRQTIY